MLYIFKLHEFTMEHCLIPFNMFLTQFWKHASLFHGTMINTFQHFQHFQNRLLCSMEQCFNIFKHISTLQKQPGSLAPSNNYSTLFYILKTGTLVIRRMFHYVSTHFSMFQDIHNSHPCYCKKFQWLHIVPWYWAPSSKLC